MSDLRIPVSKVRPSPSLVQNRTRPTGLGNGNRSRLKLTISGAVQGVGFRPFVYRLATSLALAGWVNNSPQGVFIEVEGPRPALEEFLRRIQIEKPAISSIRTLETAWLESTGYTSFVIRPSETSGGKSALVLPDIATCPNCLREVLDPANRRHRYPFTNCTHCGPRFSIIESIPYDRRNTSMKSFTMCPRCQAEYDDPRDRRFHAQPNACPACGPHLELWNAGGDALFGCDDALLAAACALRRGDIVAVKGLGGFHLMVAAHKSPAVLRLRERKRRPEKPFALLFPSVAAVKAECELSPLEEELLSSPQAPIVLLKRIANRNSQLVDSVAPGNPYLGAMLPCTPLHHLLMAQLGFPVVATSGNLADEPLAFDNHEALQRLGGIADLFLVHDRPIVRHVDDSIVRVMLGREMILRRARGYAPLPIRLETQNPKPETVLAVGAHLKNAVALSVGAEVFISQHIGDLETEQANRAFRNSASDLEKLYDAKPSVIAADMHPDYLSTCFANEKTQSGKPRCVPVQHHIAHVWSCMADNELTPPALGVSWDGAGYGLDGTIWGGEFFSVTTEGVKRVASMRPFPLPGGDQAAREPRRAALGLLHEMFGDTILAPNYLAPLAAFSRGELAVLRSMLSRGVNSPRTSSIGRLFDAVASLVNLRQDRQFEGQAAMDLEFVIGGIDETGRYPLPFVSHQALPVFDWSLMIHAIISDLQGGMAVSRISGKFHNTLAEAVVEIATRIGQPRVVLSGGCFQNRYLAQRVVTRLREEQFQPYWHRQVPPNDGGIALGQVAAALQAGK